MDITRIDRLEQVRARFWSYVDTSHDCWEWTRCTFDGYGQLRIVYEGRPRGMLTHRLSWLFAHGDLSDDLCVLHQCDNRRCVRPAHLFLGTRTDNQQDMKRKGRGRGHGKLGEEHPMAKLTAEQVREIRARYRPFRKDASLHALAAIYGVDFTTIQYITSRRTWRHVD